ncbi:hypothetical protein D3C78_1437980 [compost metagenome]
MASASSTLAVAAGAAAVLVAAGAAACGAAASFLSSPQPAREMATASRLAVARGIRIMGEVLCVWMMAM